MKYFFSIVFSLLFLSGFAQNKPIYSKIKVDLRYVELSTLSALGLETDHGEIIPNRHFINVFDDAELKLLQENGIEYKMMIKDVEKFYFENGTSDHREQAYQQRSAGCGEIGSSSLYNYETPLNYRYGTMGGYYKYDEAIEELDRMAELYPDLITVKKQIGDILTHNGNPVYYLVISDNPNETEEEESQVLYTALHHAREPNSLSQLIFYMWYLLENYGTNEEVTYLVDETAMFFIPIVNPDGYQYNEFTNPNGGGFWRKNRFVSPEGDTVGVDLNRNYGYFWAYDDFGSSPNYDSQTYRGPSAFSEPETQAVKKLCEDNFFQIALNYHTFGNLLIHPWGYSDEIPEEDVLFKSIGNVMAVENDFFLGTGTETVGYTVNGDSDDWMYGDVEEKNAIYAYTPEVGPAFWPGEASIESLNKSAVRMNLNTANLLYNFGWPSEQFVQNVLTETEGKLFFELHKSGLRNGSLKFTVVSKTDGFTLSNNEFDGIELLTGETMDFTIDYKVEDGIPVSEIELEMQVDNGNYVFKRPIQKSINTNISEPDLTIANSIDDLDDFDAFGDWGFTGEDFVSSPGSITDSPGEFYSSSSVTEIILSTPLVLTNADEAYFKFFTKFAIENDYDHVQLLASTDGANYTPLCGEYTNPGIIGQQVSFDSEVYDGIQEDWVEETICLNDYAGAELVLLKFVLTTDNFVNDDGFYFDDMKFELFGDGLSSTISVPNKVVTVVPNPSNDFFRITMNPNDLKEGMNYQLLDLYGNKIESDQITKPEQFISIEHLAPGTYFLQLTDKTGLISSSKLIKQ